MENGGSFALNSNAVYKDDVGGGWAYWNDTVADDQYSQYVASGFTASGEDNGVDAATRISSSTDTGYIFGGSDGYSELAKLVSGSYTTLGGTGDPLSASDIVYNSALGTTIAGKVNGSTDDSVTDGAISSGFVGIHGYVDATPTNTLRLDNWEGGDLAVAGAFSSLLLTGVGV